MVVLYLSGIEPHMETVKKKPSYYRQMLEVVDDRLISYWYRNSLENDFWTVTYPHLDHLMIDSGAFTFLTNNPRSKGKDIYGYCHDYCRWLEDKADYADAYVELDLAKVYGWKAVTELRKIFASYNLDPLYVYHIHNNEKWEDLCRKHDYIAVGSMDIKGDPTFLRRLLETAQKHRTRVHLFGWTNLYLLTKYAVYRSLYSVDSTSWLSVNKYGTFYWFENGQMKAYKKEDIMKKWSKRTKWEYYTGLVLSLHQWSKFAKHLKHISRDYE